MLATSKNKVPESGIEAVLYSKQRLYYTS